MQRVLVERQAGIPSMPVGVAWISPSASARLSSVPTSAPSRRAQTSARSRSTSTMVEPSGAEPERGEPHGGAGPAAAEQHDVVELGIGQVAGEVLGEAGRVGVVAGGAAVLEDDGVDRLQRFGVVGEGVEVTDHVLLARTGDVDAAQARLPGAIEHVAEVLLADLDQPVGVVEIELGGLALVQRRAQRRADARTDQSDLVPLHDPPPRT